MERLASSNKGFGLIEVLIAVTVMAMVSLEMASIFQNMNSNSNNLRGTMGAQSLKSTLMQITSKSTSCFSHLLPGYTTFNLAQAGPGGSGFPIGFTGMDGSQIYGLGPNPGPGATPVPVPNYDVSVSSLLFTSTTSTPMGYDASGGPTNGAAMYLGSLVASLTKLSGVQAIAGGQALPATTVGSLILEVDASNNIVSCYAQPLSTIDACSSLGGQMVNGNCQLPYPCAATAGTVFMGYDTNQNPICTNAASLSVLNCAAGQAVVSNGSSYVCN